MPVDNHQNVILVGGSGSAKTHLAIGLTFAAIQKSYRAKFYTLNGLAIQLLNAQGHIIMNLGLWRLLKSLISL